MSFLHKQGTSLHTLVKVIIFEYRHKEYKHKITSQQTVICYNLWNPKSKNLKTQKLRDPTRHREGLLKKEMVLFLWWRWKIHDHRPHDEFSLLLDVYMDLDGEGGWLSLSYQGVSAVPHTFSYIVNLYTCFVSHFWNCPRWDHYVDGGI